MSKTREVLFMVSTHSQERLDRQLLVVFPDGHLDGLDTMNLQQDRQRQLQMVFTTWLLSSQQLSIFFVD